MTENEPVRSCKECGYFCTLDKKSGGRWLEDIDEGKLYFLPLKIEDCEARQIMTSEFPIPKKDARDLIQISGKLK